MCGIVGAIAERNVVPILMEGLRRLEYRGYDSAGIAVLNGTAHLKRLRTVGKVKMLQDAIDADPTHGQVGIAHTRWATHGVPSERNAHPHVSHDGLAIVHNGIIENHEELRDDLKKLGYTFTSETDTEVIAHRVHHHLAGAEGSVQGRARHGGRARRRLRAGGRQRGRAGAHHPGARRLPGGRRTRRRRKLRRLGRGRAAAGDAPLHVPRGRRRRRHPPHLDQGARQERRQRRPPGARERAVGRCRREGPVPPLHAQGNPRAAARRRRHAGRARGQWQVARGRVRSGRHRRVRESRTRAHHRLRHQLSLRRGGALLHRADLQAALHRGDRQRIPLSQSGGAEEFPVRDDLAVGRNRRHAGRAAPRQAGGLSLVAGHLQRARRAHWCASRNW